MKYFTRLYRNLDNQSNLSRQQELVIDYFEKSDEQDSKWALFFLQNKSIKKIRSSGELYKIAQRQIKFSDEIWNACLNLTKNNLEAISLALPVSKNPIDISLFNLIQELVDIKNASNEKQTEYILSRWEQLRVDERQMFNRILCNSLKSPISPVVLHQALSKFFNRSIHEVSLVLHNQSKSLNNPFPELKSDDWLIDPLLLPKLFKETMPLESLEDLSHPQEYSVTCEWNGIRAQFVRSVEEFHIWSKRGELLTDKFPEFKSLLKQLPPGTIMDGLFIAHQNDILQPKSAVRKRINRIRATPKLINDIPVVFCAIDLLQINGIDKRYLPLLERQKSLENIIRELPNNNLIQLSDEINIDSWNDLNSIFTEIKELSSHAIVIKEKNKPYHSKSKWFKIKGQKKRVKGVLLYVKRGQGIASNQIQEFTLAARSGSTFVPFTRFQFSFQDDDNLRIKKFVKDHTIERFGPVFSLEAKLVFEISFESIEISKRHKCGFVLRKTNFIKWDQTATLTEVVELEELVSLL